MSDSRPLPPALANDPLPLAQALAHRIEKSKLDRAHQIARLLGDLAAQAMRPVDAQL